MQLRYALLAGAGVVAIAAPARADDAANIATARSLGVEGVTLADAGRCKEAVDKLERAERLHHAPTTATRLGECEIETGKLVSGSERLQRVVREPLPPNAHPAFAAAQARAQKVLEKTTSRIPSLVVAVVGATGTKLSLTIDGEAVSEAIVDTNRFIDPGSHVVSASAQGYIPARATISLEEGDTKTVTLELVRDPHAVETVAATSAAPEPGRRRALAPALIAFGVGAAGLGVGIVGGVNVAQKSDALDSSCDAQRVCPPEREADIQSAKTWATVSTVGFAVGAVGVLAGTLLLVTGPSSSAPAKTGKKVQPSVGLGSVGLSGVF